MDEAETDPQPEPPPPSRREQLRTWLARHRQQLVPLAGLTAFFAAVAGLQSWNASRPRPRWVTWTISAPGATPLREGARPAPLSLRFSLSASKLEDAGKPVARGVRLVPPHAGSWSWASDSELVFTPTQDWPAGQDYSVRLEPSLLPKHLRLERAEQGWKSAPFTASLVSSEFYVDPQDPGIKRVTATFRFSHPVDDDALEKRLSLVMVGEKKGLFDSGRTPVPFSVVYDEFRGEAYLRSEPVAIPAEPQTAELAAAPGIKPRRGGPETAAELKAQVRVPGMYDYFRFNGARMELARNERLEPRQVLFLSASGGVGEKELAGAARAWLLPRDRPAGPGRPKAAHHWWNALDVGPESLALSTPVALSPVPAERDYPSEHGYDLRVPTGAFVFVRVPRGLPAYGGYLLAKDFETVVRAPEYPRELKLLHEGALLRLSGDKKLSYYALGEEHVRIELGRVRAGHVSHLASQTQGDFSNPSFQSWSFGADNITERFEEVRPLPRRDPGRLQFDAVDLSTFLKAPDGSARLGLFFVRVEGWDRANKRPTGAADTRFVLVTDLGVVVKENADRTRDVFVQDLAHGGPAAGARVEALGLNGSPVASGETDAGGRARLPDLSGFARERRPAVYLVRRGDDVSFLPYERHDRRLDLTRFDVGGVSTEGRERELTAFVFTDRGLYRPGEEIHAGFIVRPNVWGQDLTGVPLELSVLDPRGVEVHKRKLALGAAGFESLDYRTQENGLTGSYQLLVHIVKDGRRHALLGSAAARVEEFSPDRLRIEARFSADAEGWVRPEGLSALVDLRTLFGTPAQARRVAGRMRLSPGQPSFREFPGFEFFDPAAARKGFSEPLADAETDADGRAALPLPLDRFADSTYRLDVSVEGFEAGGGRGVSALASVLVSPRPFLVGLKPDGDLRYAGKGSSRTVEAVAAGPDGRAVAVSSLSWHVIEERWVSSLVKGPDGLYRYQSVRRELAVSSRAFSLDASPRRLGLDTSSPGDFAFVVRDAAGVELNRVRYAVAGQANLSRSLDRNAELQLRLEKPDYAPGETAEFSVKAPYAGAGLITVERDRVLAHKWFRAATTASTQSIRVPDAVEGNAYVSVTLLRDPGSREIFMSPLSYAVAPFTVSRARRSLPVTLDAPDALKPGQTVRLRVRPARRARVAVFAADEGILQAAGWRTPDPLSHFFQKRALEVRTYQLLDLLLPEHRLSAAVMAPGGDGEGWDAVGKNLNPFKRRRDPPAVWWSGLLDAGPEGRELSFVVPDSFNGTLRLTAVAVEAGSIGIASRKALVRDALVLTPSLPNFAAPGDEFELSVAVANGAKGSGPSASALVRLKLTEHLQALDGLERRVAVPEGREASAVFRVRARPALGAATAVFEALVSSETGRREVSLSVRPPVPYQVSSIAGRSRSGPVTLATPRRLYPAYRKLEATVSPLPLSLSRGLLRYLEKYPYGCTEQVVSQAFPAVVLRARPEFGYAPEKVESNLARVMELLRSRQNEDGAFGFWAANSSVNEFHAVYAAHFLTEAKEKGYPVPPELLSRALGFLRAVASKQPHAPAPPRVRAYAIYVMTRNGEVTTPLLQALKSELDKEGKAWRKDLTAAYLAGAASLLRLDREAESLIGGVATGEPREPDYRWFYDSSLHEASYVYILARHFPARVRRLDPDFIVRVVAPLERGHYNSVSAASIILALDAFASVAGDVAPGDARLSEETDAGPKPLTLPPGLFPVAEFSPAAESVVVDNRSGRWLFSQATQSGFDLAMPTATPKARLEIVRELLDENGAAVAKARLGQELTVRLRLRSLDGGSVPHVAVVDLLNAGLEPVWSARPARPAPVPRPAPGADCEDGCESEESYDPPAPTEEGGWIPDYEDIREDRVLLFGEADAAVRERRYRVKAVNRGRFVSPPPYAEAMYDPLARALGEHGRFEVE